MVDRGAVLVGAALVWRGDGGGSAGEPMKRRPDSPNQAPSARLGNIGPFLRAIHAPAPTATLLTG